MPENVRVMTFFLAVMMSLSAMFVGLELSFALKRMGVSGIGWAGFALANVSLLFAYNYLVGTIVTADIAVFGIGLDMLGSVVQLIVLVSLRGYMYHQWKRDQREVAAVLSDFKGYTKATLIPGLSYTIRHLKSVDQLLFLLIELQKHPFILAYEELQSVLLEKIRELGNTPEVSVALAALPVLAKNAELAKLMAVDEATEREGGTDSHK